MALAAARLRLKGTSGGGGGGGPTTYVSDAFNRADNSSSLGTADTGQTWTLLSGGWGILSNQAYHSGAATQSYAVIDSTHADCTVNLTLGGTLGQGGGISFRMTDASNGWFVDSDSTGSSLYKIVTGSLIQVQTGIASWASGDVMSVVLSGSSVIIKKNGTTVYSGTQTFNQTATKHGLRDYTGVVRLDNFSVTS